MTFTIEKDEVPEGIQQLEHFCKNIKRAECNNTKLSAIHKVIHGLVGLSHFVDKPCLSLDKSHSKLKIDKYLRLERTWKKCIQICGLWIMLWKEKYYPQLQEAAKLLRENEAVAFPTETVYGLGQTRWMMKQSRKFSKRKEDRVIIHSLST